MGIKIALDAGHGLKTSGKQTPDGIKEWTLNDKVVDKISDILKVYDVDIIRTDNNEGNTDESLTSRLNMYKSAGVSAFVSVHHNAYTGKWNNATGVEVYTDVNPTSKDIQLANCVHNRLIKYTGLKDRGIKKANFYVINQNTIPAILCEGGFMDGTSDYKYIISDSGQTAYAKAVAEGLIEFLDLKKKTVATPNKTTSSTKPTLQYKIGDTVVFKGNKHYGSANSTNAIDCKGGTAKVTAISKDSKHPYHLVRVVNGGSNVYGWVDASDIMSSSTTTTIVSNIKIGSTVKINKGAKTYEGKTLSNFVYNRKYKVKEIKGNRVVVTYLGIVVAAIKKTDLTLV